MNRETAQAAIDTIQALQDMLDHRESQLSGLLKTAQKLVDECERDVLAHEASGEQRPHLRRAMNGVKVWIEDIESLREVSDGL